MRNTLEELKIFYPQSPLNLDRGGTRGPKAGERVLDTTFVRASDRATVTLGQLTRGTSWTLLAFGGTEAAAPVTGGALELIDEVASRYAGRIGVHLVVASGVSPTAVATERVLLDALHLSHAVSCPSRAASICVGGPTSRAQRFRKAGAASQQAAVRG